MERGQAPFEECKRFRFDALDAAGKTIGASAEFAAWKKDENKEGLVSRAYSFEWSMVRDPLQCLFTNIQRGDEAQCQLPQAVSQRTLSRLIDQVNRNYPLQKSAEFESAIDPESECRQWTPSRQVGRGVVRADGQILSLQCVDEDCRHVQFELFANKCTRRLGSPFLVNIGDLSSFRQSLLQAITDRYQGKDLMQLFQGANTDAYGGPVPKDLEWFAIAPKVLDNLVDDRAITSILLREKKYWQLKPREIEDRDFIRLLTVFADVPSRLFETEPYCRFGGVILEIDGATLVDFDRRYGLVSMGGKDFEEALKKYPESRTAQQEILVTFARELVKSHILARLAPNMVLDPRPTYVGRNLSIRIQDERTDSSWTFAPNQVREFSFRRGNPLPQFRGYWAEEEAYTSFRLKNKDSDLDSVLDRMVKKLGCLK